MAGLLRIVGGILFFIAGLYGTFLCFWIVQSVFGTIIAFLSLIFFPVLLGVAPWYALFAFGDYIPLLIVYGGGIPAFLCFYFAETLDLRS